MTKPAQFHSDPTTVPLDASKPLLIVDADEVILRFAEGFDRFLQERSLYLDLVSYRLHGNVKRRSDATAVLDIEVTALLGEFRTELDWLDAVEHASNVLGGLSLLLNIVVLSNVTTSQAVPRLRNLAALDLPFPLVVNNGPKGPFVKALAARASRPVFFVDDIPQHLVSAFEAAPDVFRIHLIGDERLKSLLPPAPHAHLRADNWREVDAFIREKLTER